MMRRHCDFENRIQAGGLVLGPVLNSYTCPVLVRRQPGVGGTQHHGTGHH